MLTESQFKTLLILFDNEGHAGWQLAAALGMEESNLNPLLKKLEKRKFIIQGKPRKSAKPKKREGDFKEFPYYLNNNLEILGIMMKEMCVTDRTFDIGFPLRIIQASNYIKSMRTQFKDFNEFFVNLLSKEQKYHALIFDTSSHIEFINKLNLFVKIKASNQYPDGELLEELNLLIFKDEVPPTEDKRISQKILTRLESWWFRHNLRGCLSKENPREIINYEEFLDLLRDYASGDDIDEITLDAINKLRDYEGRHI